MLQSQPDPFDPRFWVVVEHECRIYGDNSATTWCLVDATDYQWAVQWCWHINKPHATRNGNKQYFCRSQSNGRRWAPRLYLHIEIMKRTEIIPPSEAHVLVDHRNGQEFDCRRANLRWATHQLNRKNYRGY